MLETHPFGCFVPPGAVYLILGSFTGKYAGREQAEYDWFYGSRRNHFWSILETVYGRQLRNKKGKQELFSKLKIAITDIILKCERKASNNLDMNLTNIVYNTGAIAKILKKNKIRKIYFSSRFVENKFKQHFKELIQMYPRIELVTLPSPSPRYASMSKGEKIKRYKELLPGL